MQQLDKRGIHMSDAGGIVKVKAAASGVYWIWILKMGWQGNGACCMADLAWHGGRCCTALCSRC